MSDQEIVISGASGRFPECDDIDQLCEKLFNGIDMVTENDERWPQGTFGLTSRRGVLHGLDRFDNEFFNIDDNSADYMEPMTRTLIEVTYEALWDAGLNPKSLESKRVGQFFSSYWPEIDRTSSQEDDQSLKHINMNERVLNYLFNIKSCCFSYDTACSSALTALVEAHNAIKNGLCDIAIVNTATISYSPHFTLSYQRLGLTGSDGKCCFLDQSASGYVKAECVASIILQKREDATRIHAHVYGVGTNVDGYKVEGLLYPSWSSQAKLFNECLRNSGIQKDEIHYIECHGTGTKVGDKVEVQGICSTFGSRKIDGSPRKPLLLGSIKTNIGHCENSSGLASLIKALIILKENLIPPILHFRNPSDEIPELIAGKVHPVTVTTPFTGSAIPIANYGFGGANAYVIIGSEKTRGTFSDPSQPFLFFCTGRISSSVSSMIEKLKELQEGMKLNRSFMNMVNQYSCSNVSSSLYPARGYLAISKDGSFLTSKNDTVNHRPPLYYVFPGLGAQKRGFAASLMSIDSFANSIHESLSVIDPQGKHGLLSYLIEDGPESEEADFLALIMLITSMAMVETLRDIGLEPDGYFGHSFGEYVAAYCDEFLSKRELLELLMLNLDTSTAGEHLGDSCAMISVGESWFKLKDSLPKGIYPACFNSETNITLGGYEKIIRDYAATLQSKGLFVRELKTGHKAFHTPLLRCNSFRSRVITSNLGRRKRTNRWINSHRSSYPIIVGEEEDVAQLMVEIITENALFHDACCKVPSNAIVLEISPRRFLIPLLKQNIPDCKALSTLNSKVSDDNHLAFLSCIGELFCHGFDIYPEKLFPHINKPAPISTPFLSPLIKLKHDRHHLVRRYPEYFHHSSKNMNSFRVDLTSPQYKYVNEYTINGQIVIPIFLLIQKIQEHFARYLGTSTNHISTTMESVRCHKPMVVDLNAEPVIEFALNFLPITKERFRFQMHEGPSLVIDGCITGKTDDIEFESIKATGGSYLDHQCFYQELAALGYSFPQNLKQLGGVSSSGHHSFSSKPQELAHLIELFIQISLLTQSIDNGSYVHDIGTLCMRPSLKSDNDHCDIFFDRNGKIFHADSIYIKNMSFKILNHTSNEQQKLLSLFYHLEPYTANITQTISESMHSLLDLVLLESRIDELTIFQISTDDIIASLQEEISLLGRKVHPETISSVEQISSEIRLDCNTLLWISSEKLALIEKNEFQNIQVGWLIVFSRRNAQYRFPEMNIDERCYKILAHRQTSEFHLDLLTKSKLIENSIIPVKVSVLESLWMRKINDLIDAKSSNVISLRDVDLECESTSSLLELILFLIRTRKITGCFINSPGFQSDHSAFNHTKSIENGGVHPIFDELPEHIRGRTCSIYHDNEWKFPRLNYTPRITPHQVSLNRSNQISKNFTQSKPSFNFSGKAKNFHIKSIFPDSSSTKERDNDICSSNISSFVNFSGSDKRNNPVIGILKVSQRYQISLLFEEHKLIERLEQPYVWQLPSSSSLEHFAGMPIAYITIFHALISQQLPKSSDVVLINSGPTEITRAAIEICHWFGCQILVMPEYPMRADTQEYLTSRASEIVLSWSKNAEKTIHYLAKGIDLILNFSENHSIEFYAEFLRSTGRFLNFSRKIMEDDQKLGLGIFLGNISFSGVNCEEILSSTDLRKHRAVHRMMADFLAYHATESIQSNSISTESISHILPKTNGLQKILSPIFQPSHEHIIEINVDETQTSLSRTCLIADESDHGLGLLLARYLSERVEKISLNMREIEKFKSYSHYLSNKIRKNGTHLSIFNLDLNDVENCRSFLSGGVQNSPNSAEIFFISSDTPNSSKLIEENQEEIPLPIISKSLLNLNHLTNGTSGRHLHFNSFTVILCPKLSDQDNSLVINHVVHSSAIHELCQERIRMGFRGRFIRLENDHKREEWKNYNSFYSKIARFIRKIIDNMGQINDGVYRFSICTQSQLDLQS
ncbi:fatty acid synthase-like [Brevipalpus obovatus]|uniref:fatty acid synthase-like n=1 Tax=Brevipalpus obovatus TaxID=246614 RepID=UPI003D9E454B